MGDRANIRFDVENEPSMYFYTHWSGSELPFTLQKALKRGESRWEDEPYLARIIFCEMVDEDVLGITGYGLATFLGDNSYPVIVVKATKQRVILLDVSEKIQLQSWTFTEFCGLDIEEGHAWKAMGIER